MNIIKTSNYEDSYLCPICMESFEKKQEIYLIKHYDHNNGKPEKINQTRKKKHIFHASCLSIYLDQQSKSHNCEQTCPMDRQKISRLITVKYSEVVALNIIDFSHNYYELIDNSGKNEKINVSVIDSININYKDINGKTIFYCAAQRGDLKLLKQLIHLGALPTISDDNGFTPLMAAVTHNFISIVKYLLKLPAIINTINTVDLFGKTAIQYATEYQRYECVLEILKVVELDENVLKQLLDYFQKIKPNNLIYITSRKLICEIKKKLKKYLKINQNTKLQIKKLRISDILYNKIPQFYASSNSQKNSEDTKILNIDIDQNPELFELIYNPNY